MTTVPAPPITCSGCTNTWTGLSKCHCSRCHRTFGGSALFDAHQRLRGEVGYCVDPATLSTDRRPVRQDDTGAWRVYPTDAQHPHHATTAEQGATQ